MRRAFAGTCAALLIFLTFGAVAQEARRLPGGSPDTGYLLPNGWSLMPAGEQIPVGELPLALALHPDGRHLLVSNNGNGPHSIDVIDLEQRRLTHRMPVASAWLGLAVDEKGEAVFAGGGISNSILRFSFRNGILERRSPVPVGKPENEVYPGGICLSGDRLYSANNLSHELSAIELPTGEVLGTVPVGNHPYTCVVSPDRRTVYVSVWEGAHVAEVDAESLEIRRRLPTDDHPNAMAFSGDGKRLFVANANSNTVSAIDLGSGRARERISVALYPLSPPGSTPNALAVSPDGSRLYAANADNNDVAVVDVSKPGNSRVLGFIPVGWYPTALALSADGKRLFVANGKGSRSFANPRGPRPDLPRAPDTQHVAQLMLGSVSVIDVPDEAGLARHTAQVYRNVPYSDRTRLSVPTNQRTAVPRRVGQRSPIRYVIYVIKENRTYDQVFGDIPEGNGDPSLTLFGEEVTPNHHALAKEFVLLDNFYADAEVSADGHNWSMGAYATDYVEKTWPSQYSRRRGRYDYEGSNPIAAPSRGYIWDAARRAGVTYRSYGEWVRNGATPAEPATALAPALVGHIDPWFRGYDLEYSDIDRAKRFLGELKRYEREGAMPRLQIVRLGNDHTMGTRPGALTPASYVAQNDVALGLLVEGVSRSKFWPQTAIFVVEDDAQNGPDHVDAHRTVALVASPYAKRRFVDSTMYSTSSMLRTMELILGIEPMSQYDAAATPMFNSFTNRADSTPYSSRAARVSLTDVNPPDAPGAQRSMEMNLEEADAAPDVEFNEIIWKAVRGADSVMPAPIRSVFVRPIE